jgi:hypothetical protein
VSEARSWIGFVLVLAVVCGGSAALAATVSTDPLVIRAVTTSAAVAAAVQLAGFGAAKWMLGSKQGLFVAWGGAMAVRFVSLGVYALLVYKKLGLVPAPALITFAGLLMVTSIVEPLFLRTA